MIKQCLKHTDYDQLKRCNYPSNHRLLYNQRGLKTDQKLDMHTCPYNNLQMQQNSYLTLKYTYILVVVLDLIYTYCFPAQNLKHTDYLPTPPHADLQSKFNLEYFWKHRCSPPLLQHLQIVVLKMMISFLIGKEQDLNVEP